MYLGNNVLGKKERFKDLGTNINGDLFQISITNIRKLNPFTRNTGIFCVIGIWEGYYSTNKKLSIGGHRILVTRW